MTFSFSAFLKIILKENPSFSRFKKSSLTDLVDYLQKNPNIDATSTNLESLIKDIPLEKWRKYKEAKSYLIKNIDGLGNDLRDYFGTIENFRTKSLRDEMGINIVHTLEWDSSTGNIGDLSHVMTRESVTWSGVPEDIWVFTEKGYQKPGSHTGLNATTTSSNGFAVDNHSLLGPFGQESEKTIDKYSGNKTYEFVMKQVYQVSNDRGKTWENVEGSSHYTITRTLTPGPELSIKKVDDIDPNISIENRVDFKTPEPKNPSSDFSITDELNKFNHELKLDDIKNEIDRVIVEAVDAYIHSAIAPFANSVDNIFDKLPLEDIRKKIFESMQKYILTSLTQYSRFNELMEHYTVKQLEDMLNNQITKELFEKVAFSSGDIENYGDKHLDYISLTIQKRLLELQEHYLAQHSGDIQKKITENKQNLEHTREELAEQKKQLNNIEEELKKKPNDPSLKAEEERLKKEIEEMEKEFEKEQEKENAYDQETKNDQDDMDKNASDSDEVDEKQKEAGHEIFS